MRFATFWKYGWKLNVHRYWHIAGGAVYTLVHLLAGWMFMDAMGFVAVVALAWEGVEALWHSLDGSLADAGYGDGDFTPKQHFLADALVDFFGALAASIAVHELVKLVL